MTYKDYLDKEKIKAIHVLEILKKVKETFTVDNVYALEHIVR